MIQIIRGQHQQALVSVARSLGLNAHFDATYWMLVGEQEKVWGIQAATA
jgi:hypothetical protein